MSAISTLFVLTSLVSLSMAAILAVTAYRRHPEMFICALALGVHACGHALFAFRGRISDMLTIVLANALMSLTLTLFSEGIYRFHGSPPRRWLIWLPVPVTLVAFTGLLEQQPARLLASSMILSFQFGVMMALVWQKRRVTPGRGQYVLLVAGIVVVAIMALRATAVLRGTTLANSIDTGSLAYLLPFYGSLVATLLVGVGLVLMVQERAEHALRHSQDKERFRSHILERLSVGAPLAEVLREIVTGLERINPGKLCSVLLADRDGQRLMDSVAPSLPAAYNAALRGLKIADETGSCATAAFRRERVVVEDIDRHPYWTAFRDLAAGAGLKSCWSQPILSSDQRLLGTFATYHREVHAPTAADLDMIEESAQLVSLAIERSQAAMRLSESERHYRRLIESANEGICIVCESRLRFVNPKMLQLLGYPRPELEGMSYLELTHPDDLELARHNHLRRLAGRGDDLAYEARLLTKDRGARWFQVTGVLFDWQGQPATLTFLTDVHERRLADERIRQLAYHDTLTQLPNRRLLLDRLQQALAHNRRSGRHAALLFLDLDNFKPLNDTHGHTVGDLLLTEVATRLRKSVRDMDTVARFGGDEFVLLLSDLDTDRATAHVQAEAVADKVLAAMAEPYLLRTEKGDGPEVHHRCTTSIGCTLFVDAVAGPDSLLDEADAAMYQAKAAGRNTLSFFNPSR
jgi:diguanylate cyclase (GGDEF)-like protein/PAS domain S-box-containing protein